jgi:hypothetical protein
MHAVVGCQQQQRLQVLVSPAHSSPLGWHTSPLSEVWGHSSHPHAVSFGLPSKQQQVPLSSYLHERVVIRVPVHQTGLDTCEVSVDSLTTWPIYRLHWLL